MANSSESSQNNELSVEQLNAIELLIAGKSDQAVAKKVGVSRKTIKAWRNSDDKFAAALDRARRAVWAARIISISKR